MVFLISNISWMNRLSHAAVPPVRWWMMKRARAPERSRASTHTPNIFLPVSQNVRRQIGNEENSYYHLVFFRMFIVIVETYSNQAEKMCGVWKSSMVESLTLLIPFISHSLWFQEWYLNFIRVRCLSTFEQNLAGESIHVYTMRRRKKPRGFVSLGKIGFFFFQIISSHTYFFTRVKGSLIHLGILRGWGFFSFNDSKQLFYW